MVLAGDPEQVGDDVDGHRLGVGGQDVDGAGRVELGTDDLVDWDATSLGFVEAYEDGRAKFAGHVPIERTGQFGWTVRVLPRHELMAYPASLGLVANA